MHENEKMFDEDLLYQLLRCFKTAAVCHFLKIKEDAHSQTCAERSILRRP